MTNKAFYQAAAAEVSSGKIDSALWIKVNADMPEASDVVRQARYIQLRAREMASEVKVSFAERFVPRSRSQWVLFMVVDLLIASFVVGIGEGGGAVALAYILFLLLPVAALVWKSRHPMMVPDSVKVDQSMAPIETNSLISTTCDSSDKNMSESDFDSAGPVLPEEENQYPTNNARGIDWLLFVICVAVGAVLLVFGDLNKRQLPTVNVEFLFGLWIFNLFVISCVPLLFGVITLFRRPGVAMVLAVASFMVVMFMRMAGYASMQSNNTIHPNAASQNDSAVLLNTIYPNYPVEASQARAEGWVILEFTIKVNGSVGDIEVLDSHPSGVFDASAIDAVSQYKFRPAMRNGIPMATQMHQRIDFKL